MTFVAIDTDGSNTLTKQELRAAVEKAGLAPSSTPAPSSPSSPSWAAMRDRVIMGAQITAYAQKLQKNKTRLAFARALKEKWSISGAATP